MAKTEVLVDTGPLVAFFDRRDQHHAWTKTQMAHLTTPLYTCEAVLSETFHLLEHVPRGTQQLIRFLERGAVAPHDCLPSTPGTDGADSIRHSWYPCTGPNALFITLL